jgi:hypothetical protein
MSSLCWSLALWTANENSCCLISSRLFLCCYTNKLLVRIVFFRKTRVSSKARVCVCVTYLDLVSDVYDEGVGDGVDGDPLAVGPPDLQAPDVVVYEQHGHAAGVRVRRHAQRQLRLRAPGVEVDPHARPLAASAAERVLHPAGFQPQPARQLPHHPASQLEHLFAVFLCRVPARTHIYIVHLNASSQLVLCVGCCIDQVCTLEMAGGMATFRGS